VRESRIATEGVSRSGGWSLEEKKNGVREDIKGKFIADSACKRGKPAARSGFHPKLKKDKLLGPDRKKAKKKTGERTLTYFRGIAKWVASYFLPEEGNEKWNENPHPFRPSRKKYGDRRFPSGKEKELKVSTIVW